MDGGCNLNLTVENCLTLFDELGTKGKDFSVNIMVESLEQFFAKIGLKSFLQQKLQV